MEPTFKIAIVEDNLSLREVFAKHLVHEGFDVHGVASAEELDEYFVKNRANLLILDVNLPGEDGLSIARRYRNAHPQIHIIMLTVRAEVKDRVLGYDSGADIYLPKPISAQELTAAVNSAKRRFMQNRNMTNQPHLDLSRKQVIYQLVNVQLSQNETLLLKGLIGANENFLEYWQLLELIEKELTDQSKQSLTLIIHRLNKKLLELGLMDPVILAVWKEGYQLTQKISVV